MVEHSKTIELETIPLVCQLREELARVKVERDGLLKEIHGTCKTCMRYEDCKKTMNIIALERTMNGEARRRRN